MKLLSLRLCEHDSNIAYFDGDKVFYIKTERIYKEKHHAYNNLWQWKKDIEKVGINVDAIDEVATVPPPP